MHLAEHKYFYTSSHKPHHKFVSPTLFDAFDGTVLDTTLMILLPLFATANVISLAGLRSAFGATWGSERFTRIYCASTTQNTTTLGILFKVIGIGTPADHHVHHDFST